MGGKMRNTQPQKHCSHTAHKGAKTQLVTQAKYRQTAGNKPAFKQLHWVSLDGVWVADALPLSAL